MYHIAICDDEIKELEKTERYLKAWLGGHKDYEFRIDRFDNAKKLLEAMEGNEYMPEFLLLDIYMPGKTGIAAAKELRQMGSSSRIIFLTTSTEHALEAFGVDADQYLVKPVTEKELYPVLDKMLEGLEKEQKSYVLFRIDGTNCRVAFKDIVYCEAQGKNQRIHFADGSYGQMRMTMTEIYGMLSAREEFTRVGVSYIVNLDHINSLNGQEISLDTGKSIYLPRGAYQPLRERYFAYYCEEER